MATLEDLRNDPKVKKMDWKKCLAMADEVHSVETLTGLPRKIADAMIAVHGFYTATRCGKNIFFIEGN